MDGGSKRRDNQEDLLQYNPVLNLEVPDVTYRFSNDPSSNPYNLAFKYLKEITNSFSAERVLRSGIFGMVYKGVLRNGEMIEVKKLAASKPGFQAQFENECHHLMKLKHPNVVRFIGYCYEMHKICSESNGKAGKPIFIEIAERLLCSEHLSMGSLDNYLSDESSGFDWQTRYKIIEGICYGLRYLQEQTGHKPILHLDLKPASILLDDNMIPKITDFGISRLSYQEQAINTLNSNETLGYMAPEYIHGGAVTLKSDIFSLGVIILEVITGRRGFPDVTRISSEDLVDLADEILATMLEKAQPSLEEKDCQGIKRCIQIGLICTNLLKTKRPTITMIVKMLHGLESTDCHFSNKTEMSSSPHVASATKAPTSSSLGVTGPLLRKLDSLLLPEYGVPKPLANEIELLKEDLDEISAALLEQSMVDVPNRVAKLWMGEARDFSYEIEDFIDNMMQRLRVTPPFRRRKMRKKHTEADAKMRYVQTYRVGHVKIACLPMAPKPSAKIAEFRTLLREVSDRYYRYFDGSTTSSRCMFTAHGQDPASYAKAANYLVGIDDTKTKLIQWLINEDQQLKVVPIIGPSGVGKTMLAKQVYRELGMQFECQAFVRASRKPDMRRLLGAILSQVQQRPGLSDSCTVQDLIDNLTRYLQDKRYIILIDDIWETIACDILTSAFPEGNNGSRIIITAEIESVALECCDYESNNIFKMKPLCNKDSGNLFFNLVFGPEIPCPEKLKDVSDIIIAKCSGLPLATICVAGLLASQPDNFELWQHVQQCLCSSLSVNSSLEETLQEILKLSYNSTPHYLKTCVMYLGMYPEGQTIWKVDLVNQWIVEDLISATKGEETKEVAERYFSELVNRGLIQPVEITYSGEVLSCTVNHAVLDLITRKSNEEKFITTLDYSQTITGLYSNARRLSLHFSNARYATKPKGVTLSKARSFAFFGIIKCMPSIEEFKLLRVLILEFWGDHPESTSFGLRRICRLFQLRYLKISCDANVEVELPTQMEMLRYLEKLIINATVSAFLSDTIHLPGSVRTLHYVDSGSNSEGNVFSLGELMNLRDLHITYYTEKSDEHLKRNLTGLASSIGKLVNLKSFTLVSGALDTAVYYHDVSSSMSCPSVFLQRLELLPPVCIFARLPEWIGQLQKLCTLEAVVSELLIEDMDMLTGLPALTSLSLYVRQLTTGRIIFKRGAFPALKYFKYTCGVLSIAFQKEALPNLRRLELNFNAHREQQYDHLLTGIEYMLNLKEITGTIGAAAGAEKSDRMAAESKLRDAIRKHQGIPSYHIVNRAGWVDEVYNPLETELVIRENKPSSEQPGIGEQGSVEDIKRTAGNYISGQARMQVDSDSQLGSSFAPPLRLPRAFAPTQLGSLPLESRAAAAAPMEAPPTSHVTTAFSDSDSVSMEGVSGDAAADADVEALRRLSDNLAAAFRSPDDFAFLADARVAVPGAPDLRVHRCVLSARSPFLRAVFARRAAAGPPGVEGVRLELRELLGEEVEVGYEALQLVLDYLYSGRVVPDLPKSACVCVDEDGCAHVGCHPAVSFMAQVLFAASTFQVAELTNLFQGRLLDVLDMVEVDNLPLLLSVANFCNKSCMKLLEKCLEMVVRSNLDMITLEKALPPDVIQQITDSRLSLGLVSSEDMGFPNKHVRRILRALDSDDVELVRMLLKEGQTNLDDAFALHYAVEHCDSKITTELLDIALADVNRRNPRGYTVLHSAARRRDPKIVVSLLLKGARPSDLTIDGRKAVQISKRLTKHGDYCMIIEKGKPSPKDRLCIEILEQAERRDPQLGEASVSLAMAGECQRGKLLYLETRVALARIMFPIEARVAMDIAQVDGTLEFTLNSGANPRPEIQGGTVDLNETPLRMKDEHLARIRALSKTVELGKRFFPHCSNVLDKIMDDEAELPSLGRDTFTEKKRRFHDLQDLLLKAFNEYKEEIDRSTFHLPHRRRPLE